MGLVGWFSRKVLAVDGWQKSQQKDGRRESTPEAVPWPPYMCCGMLTVPKHIHHLQLSNTSEKVWRGGA